MELIQCCCFWLFDCCIKDTADIHNINQVNNINQINNNHINNKSAKIHNKDNKNKSKLQIKKRSMATPRNSQHRTASSMSSVIEKIPKE